MNRELADKISQVTLYEGYILYPYRPSVKNAQRWTFGGVYPQSWSESRNSSDPFTMQAEVLVAGAGDPRVRVIGRFLHLVDRTVGAFPDPVAASSDDRETAYQLVASLQVGDTQYQPWQEAVQRDVDAGEFDLNRLMHRAATVPFVFPRDVGMEPLKSPDGITIGVLIRRQEMIEGEIEIFGEAIADDLRKITVKVINRTRLDHPQASSRDDALMRSLVSMHLLLGVDGGDFVSLTDPPEAWQAAAKKCKNGGLWPVLVGTGSEHDTMLASPIILYDYPKIAPESPGDLFDSTEIDEILTLRILTLTDQERRVAASVDARSGDLLRRTESLAREQLASLHGTIRGMQPLTQEQSHG